MRLFVPAGSLVFIPRLVIAQTSRHHESLAFAPGDLVPRFFIDRSFPLAKRNGDCGADHHNCLDVGFNNDCCDNDSYCYVNRDGDPKCCAIGSDCSDDSPCKPTAYFCTRTITASGTATAREGCCNRKCPNTSLYLCASSLGGNCCGYDSACRAGGECATTKSASKTGLLTPVPEGCTTSQHKCSDGAGCCNNGQVCTQVSGEGYCAEGEPTGSGITVVDDSNNGDDGLSDGAKAGIGVGAVVGTSIIVGGLTWLCISKRRQRQRTASGRASGDGQDNGGAPPPDAMTDISGSQARHGMNHDYFGPDAVAGPFTEPAGSEATSPGRGRAVPLRAEGPGDITAPVEIDSTVKDDNDLLSPMSVSSNGHTPASETIDGRFELYGNETPNRPLSIVPTPPQSPLGESAPRREL
ncbi:hypothetical protein FZEAL_1255 [Fusarium zealandicum]|uniref:Uncharacterized protein n=1 Tax=Fusarium zealandicum TaxID=1053134 RepID=A0A8H4UTU4_9HYPO|nr:hypothetical protein FZEAL_1255 [Fusarium zealandicum]